MRRIIVHMLSAPIYVYRYCISPFTPMACRFKPTCSVYALQALKVHGPLKGGWLAVRRLTRCHPWGGSGDDPVPSPTHHTAASLTKKCDHCDP